MSTLCIFGLWRHRSISEATAEVRAGTDGGFEVQFSPDDIQKSRSADSVRNLMKREGFRHSADLVNPIEAALRNESTVLAPAEVLQITTAPVRTLQDMLGQLDFGPQVFS